MLQPEAFRDSHLLFSFVSFTWSLHLNNWCTLHRLELLILGILHLSGLVIWCPPHMFFILHSQATKENEKAITAARRWKKGLSAGSNMNENIQHSTLYGNGEIGWQRHHLRTPYISALRDVCQCNVRGRRHGSKLRSCEVVSFGEC